MLNKNGEIIFEYTDSADPHACNIAIINQRLGEGANIKELPKLWNIEDCEICKGTNDSYIIFDVTYPEKTGYKCGVVNKAGRIGITARTIEHIYENLFWVRDNNDRYSFKAFK